MPIQTDIEQLVRDARVALNDLELHLDNIDRACLSKDVNSVWGIHCLADAHKAHVVLLEASNVVASIKTRLLWDPSQGENHTR